MLKVLDGDSIEVKISRGENPDHVYVEFVYRHPITGEETLEFAVAYTPNGFRSKHAKEAKFIQSELGSSGSAAIEGSDIVPFRQKT